MVATVNSGFALVDIMTGGGGGCGIFWASSALPGKAGRANIDNSNLCIRQLLYKQLYQRLLSKVRTRRMKDPGLQRFE